MGNLLQDKIYQYAVLALISPNADDCKNSQYAAQRQQEARLYSACVAGLLLPAGMLTVAWTASNQVHWIVPTTGLAVCVAPLACLVELTVLVGVYDRRSADSARFIPLHF